MLCLIDLQDDCAGEWRGGECECRERMCPRILIVFGSTSVCSPLSLPFQISLIIYIHISFHRRSLFFSFHSGCAGYRTWDSGFWIRIFPIEIDAFLGMQISQGPDERSKLVFCLHKLLFFLKPPKMKVKKIEMENII